MKVLFIGMTPKQGGLETFMMNIFSELQNEKCMFEFVNTDAEPIAYEENILAKGGVIQNVQYPKGIKRFFVRGKYARKFFSEHSDYDIVHLNTTSVNAVYWAKAASNVGIKKIIIHAHNNKIQYGSVVKQFLSTFLSKRNQTYLKNNPKIIKLAASQESGEWMFDSTNFTVIRNGINTENYLFNTLKRQDKLKELNITDNPKIIITVARLEPQKNYRKIIEIYHDIQKGISNSKLVIIGDGSQMNEIRALVNSLNLTEHVIFMGERTDIAELLFMGDLMIMPSIFEAFPFALVEAQAAGVPALVSSEAIPKEANITNELKYLSNKLSSRIWADAALNVLKNDSSVTAKINMNDKVAKSEYSLHHLITQIRNIYGD